MSSCTILMRMKSSTGESCYFKDDSGRFSSDINKTHTLKVKVKTAYKLTFECPKHMRIISVSMDGAPVQMEDAPGQRPDADKVLCVGVWRTDVHFATEVSKRLRIETVLVLQVDGLKGPDSDERHLLKTKLLVKFYDPAYSKYTEKGHALGAIRFRCQIGGESGGSKVSAVTFADALHVESLRRDEHGDDHVHVTPSSSQKHNTKPITISEKQDKVVEDDDINDVLGDGTEKKPEAAGRSTSPMRGGSDKDVKAAAKDVKAAAKDVKAAAKDLKVASKPGSPIGRMDSPMAATSPKKG